MKKIIFLLALILCQFALLPFGAQANRTPATELSKEPNKREQRKAKRAKMQADFQAFAMEWMAKRQETKAQPSDKKEAKPQYGREFFLGSVLWLIFGIVVALTGLIMMAFGDIFTIIGGSILGVGLAIIASFLIYRIVTGQI